MRIADTGSVCAGSGRIGPVDTANLVPGPVNADLGPGPGARAGQGVGGRGMQIPVFC